MFLPTNTTSLIQPMDQGVIYTAKRLRVYKKKLLNEILDVEEPAAEKKIEEVIKYYRISKITMSDP